jgi:hypothetical protein
MPLCVTSWAAPNRLWEDVGGSYVGEWKSEQRGAERECEETSLHPVRVASY